VRLRGITDALARRPAEMKQLRDQLHGYENLLQENEARVQAARRALSSAESRLAATQHEHESLAAHLKALEAEEHDALAAA
jgi:chromosome segregation ATPase